MSYYVYLLYCYPNKIGSYKSPLIYTGYTKNPKRRLTEHQNGKAKFTKRFTSIEMVYLEEHKTQKEAMWREKCIKRWKRIRKQRLINEYQKIMELKI